MKQIIIHIFVSLVLLGIVLPLLLLAELACVPESWAQALWNFGTQLTKLNKE